MADSVGMTEQHAIAAPSPTSEAPTSETLTVPSVEPTRRRIVILFGKEDELLTFEETADLFGCSVPTIRRRLEDPDCLLKPIHPTPGRPFVLRSTVSAHLEDLVAPPVKEEPEVTAPDRKPRVIPAPRRRNRKK